MPSHSELQCYFLLLKGQPNGKSGQENCISISAPGAMWFDNFCSNKFASICKKKGMKQNVLNSSFAAKHVNLNMVTSI